MSDKRPSITVSEFQEMYPTKESKEKALRAMTNKQIDELIASSSNIYGKIYYSSFKKDDSGG